MKYLFLALAILYTIVFIMGLIIRLKTGEIMDSYYPAQVSMWITLVVFYILDRFDKR